MGAPLEIRETSSDPVWQSFELRASRPGGDDDTGDDLYLGMAGALVRPDGRCFVSFDRGCAAEAVGPLLDAVASRACADLYVNVDARSADRLERYASLGFVEARRERRYAIPVEAACQALRDASPLDGISFTSAEDADQERLRLLDDELRGDVPGTHGWRWTAEAFHDETYGEQYDPALYAVAVDGANGAYVGIARIWTWPSSTPRLGLIGVVRSHRRRGLARALLARVFGVLHERGADEVITEADVTNVASTSLLLSLGARETGEVVELVRRRAHQL